MPWALARFDFRVKSEVMYDEIESSFPNISVDPKKQ